MQNTSQIVGQRPPLRILVVDDEMSIGQMLSQSLTNEGYEVAVESSEQGALDLIKRGDVSLMIMDWRLTRQSSAFGDSVLGNDMLAQVRAVAPFLPIMAISGWLDDTNLAKQALAAGADCFMGKPLDLNALMQWIKLWRKRQMQPFSLIDRRWTPSRDEMAKLYVHYIYEKEGRNALRAAEILGVHRQTVSSILSDMQDQNKSSDCGNESSKEII